MNADTRRRLAAAGGRPLSASDARRLRETFAALRLDGLFALWAEAPLTGAYVEVAESDDPSGLGVNMQWMTVDEVLDEARNATPGIQAVRLGLLPIGKCMTGSGDYYYVDTNAAEYPVVRVPHTSVNADTDVLDETMIERVASSLEEFFAKCTFDVR
jgi:hypothetical protein